MIDALLHLEEDDDQGEEGEGLDESEAKDQEDHQAATSAGVASQRFASRSSGFALTEAAQAGREGHADARADRHQVDGS